MDAQTIEALSIEIGDKIYIDVANWHLFLREAHLHISLAEHLCPLLDNGNIDENSIQNVLRHFSVKLGGGKCELPLSELVPSGCTKDLITIMEEIKREM